MARAKHGKKDVEAALRFAEENGWTVTPKPSGHAWGRAQCGEGCSVSVWSTPKNPGNHANAIRRAVTNRCHHRETTTDA